MFALSGLIILISGIQTVLGQSGADVQKLCDSTLKQTCTIPQVLAFSLMTMMKDPKSSDSVTCMMKDKASCTTTCTWCDFDATSGQCLPTANQDTMCTDTSKKFQADLVEELKSMKSDVVIQDGAKMAQCLTLRTPVACTGVAECQGCDLNELYASPSQHLCLPKAYMSLEKNSKDLCKQFNDIADPQAGTTPAPATTKAPSSSTTSTTTKPDVSHSAHTTVFPLLISSVAIAILSLFFA